MRILVCVHTAYICQSHAAAATGSTSTGSDFGLLNSHQYHTSQSLVSDLPTFDASDQLTTPILVPMVCFIFKSFILEMSLSIDLCNLECEAFEILENSILEVRPNENIQILICVAFT